MHIIRKVEKVGIDPQSFMVRDFSNRLLNLLCCQACLSLFSFIMPAITVFYCTTYWPFKIFIVFDLKGEAIEGKRDREVFHQLVHSINGHNVQNWADPNPGARSFFQVSQVVAHVQGECTKLHSPLFSHTLSWMESDTARTLTREGGLFLITSSISILLYEMFYSDRNGAYLVWVSGIFKLACMYF